ncbi:fibrinogen-like protein 1 [Exaiptasia diaphana]|uniref:Fibrinogen C-terminal domain-containing protein n=1 Tax=Exaiptasia diaphana TaxID=2652724 RepID=A0A913XQX5_EXADI|nr:fibrinogen-like protein 1 [Exaiptasia diaphana]XP_020908818.1 fibrinogen-like protein 1 [Exaiptasia diaphana]
MLLKEQVFVFTFLIFFLTFFEQCYQLQAASQVRRIPASIFFPSSPFYTVKRNKRQRHGKMKVARVHDDMACIQQCSRLVSVGCAAVNFKKDVINRLHDCELLMATQGNIEDEIPFEDNQGFDHFVLKNPTFRDCAEIMKKSRVPSGLYSIRPSANLPPIEVMCDMTTDGGGWTIIQNRLDGSVDFYRDWANYKRGFGNKPGEYWLGLDAIHSMTSQGDQELRVDLDDFEGNTRYAEYDTFIVGDEGDNYRLTLGKYSGNAGDSLSPWHNNMAFSTKDRDNDINKDENCAIENHGGWWYAACHQVDLNGLYLNGPYSAGAPNGVHWLGRGNSLKRAVMKIRPKDF